MRSETESYSRFFFTLFAVVFFFGVLESLARVKYSPSQLHANYLFEYDSDKVYTLKKNAKVYFAKQWVTTSSLGYRDREYSVTPRPRSHRFLAVGDSLTFGNGVKAEETFAKRLEELLTRGSPKEIYEVVNTAVPGNSPFQEYFDLERGLALKPELVLLQFALNDVVEPYLVYRRFGGAGIDYHGIEDSGFLRNFLIAHSAFYLSLGEIAKSLLLPETKRGPVHPQEIVHKGIYDTRNLVFKSEDPRLQEAWRQTLGELRKMASLCRREGIPLILMASPMGFQIDLSEELDHPQKTLREFAKKERIPFLDVLTELRRLRARELPQTQGETIAQRKTNFWQKYFIDQSHYSPEGHRWVAGLLKSLILNSWHPTRTEIL